LLVTDVIDEDTSKHHRPAPLSTMFFGTYGLFSRPGQSLGPMLAWHMYRSFDSQPQSLLVGMAYVPAVLALLQLALWGFYTLGRPSSTFSVRLLPV
jgi:Na+/melibiose symporter-like transporter